MRHTLIQEHENFAIVELPNGEIIPTYISKNDNGFKYIIGYNKELIFLNDLYVPKTIKKDPPKAKELKEYMFEVDYEHKGRVDGWAYKRTKVKAYSYEEAIKKVHSKFNNIFEIADW
jgi:hypothetical protein